jgi:hypothetical protein
MKKLQLFLSLILVLSAVSYTQSFGQNTDFAAGFNKLQNYPDPFEQTTAIKFDLVKDCYVKLLVVNLETGYQTVLIDGEMGSGKQGVVFKTNKRINSTGASVINYRCTLEIYTLTGNTLINTSEIKMIQK